jgi:hypothetical protein
MRMFILSKKNKIFLRFHAIKGNELRLIFKRDFFIEFRFRPFPDTPLKTYPYLSVSFVNIINW